MDKQAIFIKALASIASNLGRGSIRPSREAEEADPLRIRATEALQEAGYDYYEDVGEERKDGWFTKEEVRQAMEKRQTMDKQEQNKSLEEWRRQRKAKDTGVSPARDRLAKKLFIQKYNEETWDDLASEIKEFWIKDIEPYYQFIEQEVKKKLVKWLDSKHLFVPVEMDSEGTREPVQYVGCYVLRWGKDTEPTMGFKRLSDEDEWQALRKEVGLDG